MVLSLPVVDAVEASASSSQVRAGRSIWLLPARFHHSLCCISFDLFCWCSLTMLAFCLFCAISEHCECPEPSLQTLLSSLFLCPFTTARAATLMLPSLITMWSIAVLLLMVSKPSTAWESSCYSDDFPQACAHQSRCSGPMASCCYDAGQCFEPSNADCYFETNPLFPPAGGPEMTAHPSGLFERDGCVCDTSQGSGGPLSWGTLLCVNGTGSCTITGRCQGEDGTFAYTGSLCVEGGYGPTSFAFCGATRVDLLWYHEKVGLRLYGPFRVGIAKCSGC